MFFKVFRTWEKVNLAKPVLPYDSADIFADSLLISYCSFSFLILSSIAIISFYIFSKRFFLKLKGASDLRAVSLTKKAHGFAVNFLWKFKSLWWIIKFDLLKLSIVWDVCIKIMCRIWSKIVQYGKIRLCNKNKRNISFLPLINNCYCLFFLIAEHNSNPTSNKINILHSLFELYSICWKISSISFKYSIKALESLQKLKPTPSTGILFHMDTLQINKFYQYLVGDWLSHAFVLPDPESSTINILYGWSEICSQFGFFVFYRNIIKEYHFVVFYYIVTFNFWFFTY